jgi:putative PIN family toxin of toxin-antitoxin system
MNDIRMEIKIIVADTNWWISLVIKKFNNRFAELLASANLKFVTSDELTDEIKKTLSKERLQKHLNNNLVSFFWRQYTVLVTRIEIISTAAICRDPDDNFLLALAKDSNAGFLIKGDKDLLAIQKFENTVICTLTDFIDKYFQSK